VNSDTDGNADVCGLSGTYIYNGSSYRDTDWYDCVGGGGTATMSVTAEFQLQIIFIYGTDCGNLQYDYTTSSQCVEATLSRTVADGTHFWPWVGPSVFTGVSCNSDYWMHLSGLHHGPAYGACCICLDCTITDQDHCSGLYMGDGTTCEPNLCAGGTPGACCHPDGTCSWGPECACGGIFQGEGVSCEPNPCGTPTQQTSWGAIKYLYRRP
jgi:hypothetical protein